MPDKAAMGLAWFSAISAIAGGALLVVFRGGSSYTPPLEVLEHTPFPDFLVPGLMLGVIIGGSSLLSAVLMGRRSRAAIDATIVAGGALTLWIVAEVAMMRTAHALHLICGAVGVSMLALGVRAAWTTRAPRHRWVIFVTVAETVGFLVPACVGILATRANLGGAAKAAVMAGAGLAEGLALGIGQSSAFPWAVRRLPYALLTSAGAGIVWLSVMATMLLAHGASPPMLVVAVGLVAGLTGLAAIGGAQWIELRHHTKAAHRWIAWSALAWVMALPFSFAPGPFVDETTPFAAHVALWACGGALMAYVMAVVTWQGVRRLT